MKPIDFEVECKYKCDRCGTEYWLTSKEVKTPGFKVACCHTLNIDPIKAIFVRLEYLPANFIEKLSGEAYASLKSFGYSYEQIKMFQEFINASTKEELVRKFLAVQNAR